MATVGVLPAAPPDDAAGLLRSSELLCGLDARLFDAVAAAVEWFECPSGVALFAAGDAADCAYLVARGRFEAHVDDVLLNELSAGDIVGETGLLGRGVRNASVTAVRDSLVARVGHAALLTITRRLPEGGLRLAEITAQRASFTGPSRRLRPPRLVALVGLDTTIATADIASQLAGSAARVARTALVRAGELQEWYATGGTAEIVRRAGRLEAAHDLVLLVVEGASGFDALDNEFAWRVLAQVDLVVALCRDHTARRPGLVQAVERIERPHQVVLMRDVGCRPSVRGWDDVLSARRRNRGVGHLEHGSTHDLARLVRRLLGRSVGVALGGGGARGFAHIGALRALCEAGVQVDRVGGTSMGAVMGAQFAMGWAPERMLHENDGSWLRRSLADVHLPRVSLARGTRALALLESFFGDRRIEELALDFFCTTTNLSECRLHVARRGLVAHWVAASAAVPGIWPPLTDSAGHLHVDGGVLDNVPTDVMRDAEPGPVIAIDVCHRQSAMTVGTRQADGRLRPLVREPRRYVRERTPGLLDILSRCNMLASMQSLARAGEHADLYLTPDVEEFGFRAFQRVRELADVGYRSTMRQLEHADLSALTG